MLVNQHADLLNRLVRENFRLESDEGIEWVSPLADDEYAEYRDASFLRRLGVELGRWPLCEFWPRYGPQWDALGRTDQGTVFLVEAKANIPEFVSSCQRRNFPDVNSVDKRQPEGSPTFLASGHRHRLVRQALSVRKSHRPPVSVAGVEPAPAYLLFIYFIGDKDVDGPQTAEEWRAAIEVAERVLGLPARHRLSDYVADKSSST